MLNTQYSQFGYLYDMLWLKKHVQIFINLSMIVNCLTNGTTVLFYRNYCMQYSE